MVDVLSFFRRRRERIHRRCMVEEAVRHFFGAPGALVSSELCYGGKAIVVYVGEPRGDEWKSTYIVQPMPTTEEGARSTGKVVADLARMRIGPGPWKAA